MIVAVAIADVNRAVRSESDIGGHVEVSGVETGDALRADCEEKFSVVRKLEDLMKPAIGEPHVVVAVDAKSVRLKKTIFAPGGKEFAGSSVKTEDCGRGD